MPRAGLSLAEREALSARHSASAGGVVIADQVPIAEGIVARLSGSERFSGGVGKAKRLSGRAVLDAGQFWHFGKKSPRSQECERQIVLSSRDLRIIEFSIILENRAAAIFRILAN